MKHVLTFLMVISFTTLVDATKRTRHLRQKSSKGKAGSVTTVTSKGKGSSASASSKGKGSSCSKGSGYSSKAPKSKGKGSYSSKAPSGKGKGSGYSSKAPSSKGKGYSSKSPSSKGKGCPASSPTKSPSMVSPSSMMPTVQSAQLFCAGFTEIEYNSLVSRATVSTIPGQPINQQAATFVQQEKFCPDGANKGDLEELMHERYAIAAFYFASGGPGWKFCSQGKACDALHDSWLTKSHVCNWYGVSCDTSKRVTGIRMASLGGVDIGFNGQIANEVYELSELVVLKLEFEDGGNAAKESKLKGNISNLISTAKNLQVFDIDNQSITGEIPSALYDVLSLREIDLDGNKLGGTLSGPGIAKLKNLVFFSASGNAFGPQNLPWQFGTIKSLSFLGLSGANLIGTVPPYFKQLTNMRALDLRNNNLVGTIDFISNYSILESIALSGNDFTGSIPASVWSTSSLKVLNFEDTSLQADFSDLGLSWNMPELEVLRLANNPELSGPLPVEGLKKLTKLKVLSLENTKLTGTIPADYCSNWTITISQINSGIVCPAKCTCIRI